MKPVLKSANGFTVIELLTGMTLVVVIVLFLSKVVTDATAAWGTSSQRVEATMSGRAALQFMARELAAAIVTSNLTLRMESNVDESLGVQSDRIYFITSDQRARLQKNLSTGKETLNGGYYRHAKGIAYKVSPMKGPDGEDLNHRYRITRAGLENYESGAFNPYTNETWWSYIKAIPQQFNQSVVENVRALDFWVYDANGNSLPNYDSKTSAHGPPAYLDMMVELLPDSDARKIALISDPADRAAYADRVARRYTTRIHFHNREGYSID